MTADQGVTAGLNANPVHIADSGLVGMVIDAFDPSGFTLTVPVFLGRHIRAGTYGNSATYAGILGPASAGQVGDTLLSFGGRGSYNGGITTSNSAAISFAATENWTDSNHNGAEIIFATTANNNSPSARLNHMFVRSNGRVEIMTAFNALCGLSTDLGYSVVSSAGNPSSNAKPFTPGGSYGGLVHKSGFDWWLWDGSSWTAKTLGGGSSGGGITSINGGSNTGPAITISAGLGVNVDNPLVNNIRFNIGQPVATTDSVGFAFVNSSNAYTVGGVQFINNLRQAAVTSITVSTSFNAVCALATDLGFMSKSTGTGTTPLVPPSLGGGPFGPGGSYGALVHRSGRTWWSWDPSTLGWNAITL